MTRNAILFHLGDNPFTQGGLGVFFGKRNLQSGALFPGRKSAEGKTPDRRLRKAKLSERGVKCRVKAMLHEAVFLATCLVTNFARQVARKISRVTPHATGNKMLHCELQEK